MRTAQPATETRPQAGAAPGASVAMTGPLRTAIVASDWDARTFYRKLLGGLGHQVCLTVVAAQLAEQCRSLRPDLLVIQVHATDWDAVVAAETVCRDRPVPIIVVVGEGAEVDPRALANDCVFACLFEPVKVLDVAAAITLTVRRFERWQALRAEIDALRQALEERKLIDRAKGMLMHYTGVEEQDAYWRLRALASIQNRKLAEVARAVLAAAEVFQQLEGLACDRNTDRGHRHSSAHVIHEGPPAGHRQPAYGSSAAGGGFAGQGGNRTSGRERLTW